MTYAPSPTRFTRRGLAAGFAALAIGFGLIAACPPALAQTILGAAPPLLQAVEDGDLERAQAELLRGENPNMVHTDGRNGVVIAARNGDLEMIELLIDGGGNPNWQDDIGNSPLHWAIENGDYATVDLLLSLGASPDPRNRQGLTPVMAAARDGYRDIVERLLEADADLGVRDYTGRSALDYARTSRAPGIEPVLRAAGAQ